MGRRRRVGSHRAGEEVSIVPGTMRELTHVNTKPLRIIMVRRKLLRRC